MTEADIRRLARVNGLEVTMLVMEFADLVEQATLARCEKKAHEYAALLDRKGQLLKGRAVREVERLIASMGSKG